MVTPMDVRASDETERPALDDLARLLRESERKCQLLERLEEILRELPPKTNALWREIARLGAKLVNAAVGAVYVRHANNQPFELQASHGSTHLKSFLAPRCWPGEGFIGLVDPDRVSRRWPDASAAPSPSPDDAALKAALAVPIRGTGIEVVLLVADDAARRSFTDIDLDILERFVRHAADAYRRVHLNPESRQLARFKILHQISDYTLHQINDDTRTTEDLDRVVHAVLTGITAGYGLGFNRAALFLVNEARKTLDCKMAVGNLTWEEASADWQRDRQTGPQDFGEYLSAVRRSGPMPSGRLHGLMCELSIPLDNDGDALRSPKLLLAGKDIGRLPPELRGILDPDDQTQILLVRLMTTRQIGLVIVDNRFTKEPAGPDDVDALVAFASTAAVAIESIQVRDESKLVDRAVRALNEQETHDVAAMMERIVREAVILCDGTLGVFWPYHQDSQQFGPLIAVNLNPKSKKDMAQHEPRDIGTAQTILDEGYLAIKNVDGEEELLDIERRRLLVEAGIHSFQGVALQVGSERLGALYIDYDRRRDFNDANRRLLKRFAMHAALALKSARLSRRARDAQRTMEALVAPLTTLERTVGGIATLAKDVLECDVVTLHVYNASTDTFERPPRHAGNLVDEEAARLDPEEDSRLVRWVMEQPGPVLIDDVKQEPSFGTTRFTRVENIQSCMALPLKGFDLPVGALFANFHGERRLTSDQRMRGGLFASQAAVEIENALKLRESERMAFMTRELLSSASLQQTLNAVAKMAADMFGSRDGSPVVSQVVLQEGSHLVIRAIDGGDTGVIGMYRPRGAGSQAGFAAEWREAVIASYEPDEAPPFSVDDEQRRNFKSGMSARMIAGEEDLIGVLEIRSERFRRFGKWHAALLSTLAAHAAMAIKSDQRSAGVRRSRGHLQALREAERSAESVRRGKVSREKALSELLKITVDCFQIHSVDPAATTFGTLFLLRPPGIRVLEGVYPPEVRERFVKVFGLERNLHVGPIGITGRTVRSKSSQLGLNLPNGHRDYLRTIAETRSEIAAPIISCEEVVGVLNVESPSPHGFDQDDVKTLETLAGFVAIALANHGIQHIQLAAHDLRISMRKAVERTKSLLSSAYERDPSELRGRLKQQVENFDFLYRLTQDIMAAAMITNEQPLQERQASLAKLVESEARSWKEAAAEKLLDLDWTIPVGDPVELLLDEDRMRQVITNIIANAVKYSRSGGKIEVRVTRGANPDHVIVAVIDEGRGTPPATDLERLFEPYYRVQPERVQPEEQDGQGLGLSIAKTLVELHGGHIRARVNDRGGLTVTFELDTKRGAAAHEAHEAREIHETHEAHEAHEAARDRHR
jgi:signal transduction histidine kinase